jgi:ABC-type Fe3+-hydroxamate transport system substrate-binding protein
MRPTLTAVISLSLVLAACAPAPAAPTATAPVPTGVPDTATVPPTELPTAAPAAFPLTITDAAGTSFTFDTPPKIGCLWYGCDEIMADLGFTDYVTSMAPEDIGTTFYTPQGEPAGAIKDYSNVEEWAAAEVDVIVTRVPADPTYEALAAAAPVFLLHQPSFGQSSQSGYQAYLEDLRLLGQLTGQPEAAQAAIERFETALTNLKLLGTPETRDLSVAVLFPGEGYFALDDASPFCAVLAEAALGRCLQAPFYEEINAEEFLRLNPDWIVYQNYGGLTYADRTDPVWSQLAAVKDGQVYDASSRYYCCSARALIEVLQEYVHHVLPDAGIPDPGPEKDFDPLKSVLVMGRP